MDVTAPTRADAERAAEELAAAGAGQVLLFGSLARGDADPRSDIDLVAIFDDLDYSQRWNLKCELSSRAGAVAGHSVDIFVTDRPEWRHRVERVSASFEAGIAPEAVVLTEQPCRQVWWDKEIGLATSNEQEANRRLLDAAEALSSLEARLAPDVSETVAARSGDTAESDWRQARRMVDICTHAHMATENALKALVALTGAAIPYSHNIDSLISDTPPAVQDRVRAALRVAPEVMSLWRTAGAYAADRPELSNHDAADLAGKLAATAVDVTSVAADELETALSAGDDRQQPDLYLSESDELETALGAGNSGSPAVARLITASIRDHLSSSDLLTGKPAPTRETPEQP